MKGFVVCVFVTVILLDLCTSSLQYGYQYSYGHKKNMVYPRV